MTTIFQAFIFSIFFLFLSVSMAVEDPSTFTLDPQFEGIYSINIECRDKPPSQQCLDMEGTTKMVVMNTSSREKYGPYGICITIINQKVAMPRYKFVIHEVKRSGSLMVGRSYKSYAGPAEISLEINYANKILGWVRDPLFQADLKITGEQLSSPKHLYKEVSDPTFLADLQGSYDGGLSEVPGVLSLRPSLGGDPILYASFLARVGAKIYFRATDYYPKYGVIHLLNDAPMKWVLVAKRDSEGKIQINGMGFSTEGGNSYPLSFSQISSPIP